MMLSVTMINATLPVWISAAQATTKQIPPEVSNPYMVMGYAVVLLILFLMVAYLINRSRRLRQEWALLTEMAKDEPQQPSP